MSKKLALLIFLMSMSLAAMGQSLMLKATSSKTINGTVPNQLIIVPRVLDVGVGHQLPYEVFAIYTTQRAFVAVMPSKIAATQYSANLVKQGMYSDYKYAEYKDYEKFELH